MRHLLFIIFNHLLRAAFLSGHNIACRFHISLFVAMSRYGLRHLFTFIPFRHLPRAHFPGFHAIRGCDTSSSAHLALLLEVFRLSPSFFYHLSSLNITHRDFFFPHHKSLYLSLRTHQPHPLYSPPLAFLPPTTTTTHLLPTHILSSHIFHLAPTNTFHITIPTQHKSTSIPL
ncbi:uncharacterized protein BKA55DRAFT_379775 [Fusarium redolens]|uniref:Secreted protein n=1 Tax=Fusarium redolens TaxID=48865 RepID=A0A9P9H138_FUSRE|nr:uncharacterized protein BKA55DRAFT_379775 [Fusarium redolens]KAH7248552.1 hypothetical protein BKA55DRAFT_379775 [Fusarium redolens]